jgi:predicted metalloendopeptidase
MAKQYVSTFAVLVLTSTWKIFTLTVRLELGENICRQWRSAPRISRVSQGRKTQRDQAFREAEGLHTAAAVFPGIWPELLWKRQSRAVRGCSHRRDPHAPWRFRVNGTVQNMPEVQRRSLISKVLPVWL